MHCFDYIAFDHTMLGTTIDRKGKETIAKYQNPLGYRQIRCGFAIKPID